MGKEIDINQFELLRYPARTIYEHSRVELAGRFVAFWEKMRSIPRKRGRGRPKGSSAYPIKDAEVIVELVRWMFGAFKPRISLAEAEQLTLNKLSEVILDRIERKTNAPKVAKLTG